MMNIRMRIASVCALGALSLIAVAGCGASETSEAIASFDPQEVQYLRDNAKENEVEIDDELLLSTLKIREECRIIGAGLADLSTGVDADSVADGLGAAVELALSDNQDELAGAYTEMIDEARLGDSSRLVEFHQMTCSDVK